MKTKEEIQNKLEKQENKVEKYSKQLANMTQMMSMELGDKITAKLHIAQGKVDILKWMLK